MTGLGRWPGDPTSSTALARGLAALVAVASYLINALARAGRQVARWRWNIGDLLAMGLTYGGAIPLGGQV